MHRTTIMLPEELKAQAERRARRLGVSFGKLVREALAAHLATEPPAATRDPLFADHAVYDGPVPSDLSEQHDDYLYGDDA